MSTNSSSWRWWCAPAERPWPSASACSTSSSSADSTSPTAGRYSGYSTGGASSAAVCSAPKQPTIA
eukprot:5053911-Alexandrium_andersonii.AAC.1